MFILGLCEGVFLLMRITMPAYNLRRVIYERRYNSMYRICINVTLQYTFWYANYSIFRLDFMWRTTIGSGKATAVFGQHWAVRAVDPLFVCVCNRMTLV